MRKDISEVKNSDPFLHFNELLLALENLNNKYSFIPTFYLFITS